MLVHAGEMNSRLHFFLCDYFCVKWIVRNEYIFWCNGLLLHSCLLDLYVLFVLKNILGFLFYKEVKHLHLPGV